MSHFIIGFTVYTLGTIGLLVLGYVLAKYFINSVNINNKSPNKNYMKVEQAISLEPRKFVYILKAGNQRFLVGTTPEHVSYLGELNKDNFMPIENTNNFIAPQMHPELQAKLKYINFIKGALNKPNSAR